ncbi:MAG: DUF4058 family protein [Hormoscilla sp. GM102CHS1]|nr:DUF4058 family protein [Hormoscilla sp. GM102CHS1]
MPSPFPGMDPYLEHPQLWPGVHHWLIIEIARVLSPQLLPKYRVAVEVRMYETGGPNSLLVGIPDLIVKREQREQTKPSRSQVAVLSQPVTVTTPIPEMIKEGYLEVQEVGTGEVVTALEILSPKNKRSGEGRNAYQKKRQRVLGSATNLVEIDLLRGGKPMPFFGANISSDYRILVSRENQRPYADLYAFNLPEAIPSFPLPLQSGDVEPVVDLQRLLNEIYDLSGYDLVIDYSKNPEPPLSEANAAWASSWLREKGL